MYFLQFLQVFGDSTWKISTPEQVPFFKGFCQITRNSILIKDRYADGNILIRCFSANYFFYKKIQSDTIL